MPTKLPGDDPRKLDYRHPQARRGQRAQGMTQGYKIAIPVFVLGFLAGAGFWYLFSPAFIDRVVSEELPAGLELSETHNGQFRDVDGAHRGSGAVRVLSNDAGGTLIRFTDFEVTNGPGSGSLAGRQPRSQKVGRCQRQPVDVARPAQGQQGRPDLRGSRRRTRCPSVGLGGNLVRAVQRVLFSVATLSSGGKRDR
jgi:hypothetical protein